MDPSLVPQSTYRMRAAEVGLSSQLRGVVLPFHDVDVWRKVGAQLLRRIERRPGCSQAHPINLDRILTPFFKRGPAILFGSLRG